MKLEPLKIAYLASSPISSTAANSVHVMHMCSALSRAGHIVTLLVPCYRVGVRTFQRDMFESYGIQEQFSIFPLWNPRIRSGGFIYRLLLRWNLWRLSPELVYGRNLDGCTAAASAGWPTVYEAHKPVWHQSKQAEKRFSNLVASTATRRLVVISQALREELARTYPEVAARAIVAPDAAPDWACPEQSGKAAFGDSLRAVYAGGLYEGKGIELILDLAPRCPAVTFYIVGGTESEIVQWKHTAKGQDLSNIVWVGRKQHREVLEYLCFAHVLLAPYQNVVRVHGGGGDVARWMSPLKIFEYMAAGRPIIASDLPVLREVLRHNDNAVLVPPDSPEYWREALQRLQDDRQWASLLARSARQDFLRYYTWDSRAETLLSTIK